MGPLGVERYSATYDNGPNTILYDIASYTVQYRVL